MGRELKSSVSIAASLLLGFLLLFSQSATNTVSAGTGQPDQDSTAFSSAQLAIARIPVKTNELELLIASGVNLLDRRTGDDVYVLTTLAKLEELKQQGWLVTILYVRDLEGRTWQSVEAPLGGCAYSITPTERTFTGAGGVSSFTLTTGASCEWIVLSDSPWLQINGVGQGTGSSVISFTVTVNNTGSGRIGQLFVGGQFFTVFQAAQFNDVPVDHPFYTEISKISARGITVGCGNNNFCPDAPVTREQMAAFIMRALGEFNPPTPAMQRFTDVPPSNPFYNFIDRLAELTITNGCTATTYCPTSTVTREQAAALLIRALGEFNPPTPAIQRFTDVPPSNPFYNFIDRLAALGITAGCSASPPMFCPTSPMTRAQMAAFLVRTFDL
jgi:hypothetical protein